jgi:hypothetical protein
VNWELKELGRHLSDNVHTDLEEKRTAYLFCRSGKRIRLQKINNFAEIIFRCVETPSSVSDIENSIRDSVDIGTTSKDSLRSKIINQLAQAYSAGVVDKVGEI